MGTLSAAEALGIAGEYGSITLGKRAALIVVPTSAGERAPIEAVLAYSGSVKVLSTEY
jgi:cytosine/adenosine deaminase-related metal-dependent hydrolase